MIPSPRECLLFMAQYAMLDNIREHSIMVARVAERLTCDLIERGLPLSRELTVAAALLHDIAKTRSITEGGDHAEMGRTLCLALHLPEALAEIVGEHVILKHGLAGGRITEKEIVYYADKRVKHDRIVPLADRLEYILERYGQSAARRDAIHRNFVICQQLETNIFAQLPYAPGDIAGLIEHLLPCQAFGRALAAPGGFILECA